MANQLTGNHRPAIVYVVRFHLGPLLQGQTRIPKLKSAYISKYFAYLVSVQVAPINTYAPSLQRYICVNHNTLYVTFQPCPVRGYTASRCNL